MNLCTTDDLKDYILEAYLTACETQNPGLTERTIEAVSDEIKDMLANHYPQPWAKVPSLVKYIAAVIAAYRTAGAITTLVTTEGSTGNEWLPLQKEWKRATELLDKIATGKITLSVADEGNNQGIVSDNGIATVITDIPLFDLRGF